jgi:hypothetical protein
MESAVGAGSAVPTQAIEAVLQQDPLSTSFRQGGAVLDEQIVIA